MNISEVYIGPLVVGILAIVTLALPAFPELVCSYKTTGFNAQSIDLAENVVLGTIVIGFIYLIGVVLDRVIDSVLEPIGKHNRLQFACKQIREMGKKLTSPGRKTQSSNEQSKCSEDYTWSDDPFPEDVLRAAVMLKGGEAANAWIEGLRTRIRLMRTAAFMAPAVAFALTFAIARCSDPATTSTMGSSIAWFYVLLVVAIGLPMAIQSVVANRDRIRDTRDLNEGDLQASKYRWLGTFKPPRTDKETKLRAYAKVRRWINEKADTDGRSVLFDVTFSAFALYLLLLTPCAILVGWKWNILGTTWWIPASGLAISLVALWAWWRTTGTFMSYLDLLGKK